MGLSLSWQFGACGEKVLELRGHAQRSLVFPPVQELERLEVERVEMIRQHLCQYTQLRHETDMFNQSVSSLLPGQGQQNPRGTPGQGESHLPLCHGRLSGH